MLRDKCIKKNEKMLKDAEKKDGIACNNNVNELHRIFDNLVKNDKKETN